MVYILFFRVSFICLIVRLKGVPLWILFYKKYLFLLIKKCVVKNVSIVIVKIVLKEVKQKQEVKDIFIETIQKIIDSSQKTKQYYSDGYTGYFNLNYHGGEYKYLNNKSQTYNIGVKDVN